MPRPLAGKARLGVERCCKTRRCVARQAGEVGNGVARLGKARFGRLGKAMFGWSRLVLDGETRQARYGLERRSVVSQGEAGRVKAGLARRGSTGCDMLRLGKVGQLRLGSL